jgi:hypothetical protein
VANEEQGVQSDPYRAAEDRLGASERESEAIRVLGRLRDRTRTIVLAAFGAAGVIAGIFGYWYTEQAQFKYNHGVALGFGNLIGTLAAWVVVFAPGIWVSRRVVAARMPGWVDQLARDYEVPRDRIAATAEMVGRL